VRSNRVKFADMETEYLRCRRDGHAWDEFTDATKPRAQFGYRLSLRCDRCTTTRHDIISIVGDVVQRHYEYPDGYQLAGTPGQAGRQPASRAEVRRELYLRRRSEQKRTRTRRSA
jgi:hypothetical protein